MILIEPDKDLRNADWLKTINADEPLASAETEEELAVITGYVGRIETMRGMPFYEGWLRRRPK